MKCNKYGIKITYGYALLVETRCFRALRYYNNLADVILSTDAADRCMTSRVCCVITRVLCN